MEIKSISIISNLASHFSSELDEYYPKDYFPKYYYFPLQPIRDEYTFLNITIKNHGKRIAEEVDILFPDVGDAVVTYENKESDIIYNSKSIKNLFIKAKESVNIDFWSVGFAFADNYSYFIYYKDSIKIMYKQGTANIRFAK